MNRDSNQGTNDDLSTLALVRIEGGVGIVTMNLPERRNAFGVRMRHALVAAFDRLMHDEDAVRAVVLTGAGGHFCSGGDLSEMTTAPPPIAMRERVAVAGRLLKLMWRGPKPVVAAVEGRCIGAGVSLAAACDLVGGGRDSTYACSFVKMGLMPDTGAVWTLPQKLGAAKARELMMTGAMIDALEAHRIGLLSAVVEPGEGIKAAIRAGATILEAAGGDARAAEGSAGR